MDSVEIAGAQDTGEQYVNRADFQRLQESDVLGEFDVSSPSFSLIMQRVDQVLFSNTKGKLSVGWRKSDVVVGQYLPPKNAHVPLLIDSLAKKANGLWPKLFGKPDEERFAAWVLLNLLYIHPKLDGNGRFAKAVASVILNRDISGFKNRLWSEALALKTAGIVEAVTKKIGVDPTAFAQDLPPENDSAARNNYLRKIYRGGGNDYPTNILREEIDRAVIDEHGVFHSSEVNPEALATMTRFVSEAPHTQISS